MSLCIPARTARLALRKHGGPARLVDIAFPAKWSRSTLLAYARAEHNPIGETVRIVEWRDAYPEGSCSCCWPEPFLWLANPDGFADYRTGKRET